jgi:hypothetical protein
VIAGDGELWDGGADAIEVGAGSEELALAGALGEVAAVDDQGRLEVVEVVEEPVGDGGLLGAEVEVGDVGDDGHGRSEANHNF